MPAGCALYAIGHVHNSSAISCSAEQAVDNCAEGRAGVDTRRATDAGGLGSACGQRRSQCFFGAPRRTHERALRVA